MSLVLVAIALLALRFAPGKPETSTWHPVYDPLVILLCGVGSATLIQWTVPFHMPAGSITASDFPEYCDCILALADGHSEIWSGNRSTFPTWLPALFYKQFGVIDGFLAAAVTSSAITAMAVALWARALHSRLAAILASVCMAAFSPLVISSRMINLYPEIGAILALGSGGVALAMRYPRASTLLLASAAASLTLLGELRGIIWAIPLLGTLGLCTLRGARKTIPVRLVCVLVPLVLVHQWGSRAYPEGTSPLEHQVNLQFRFAEMGLTDARYQPPWDVADSHYVWGRSSLLEIPKTLSYLRGQRQYVPEYETVEHLEDKGGGAVTRHWLNVLPFAALLTLISLRNRPWMLFTLFATTLPFLVSLQGTVLASRSVLRFLANSMVFAPVILGVAGAYLTQGRLEPQKDTGAFFESMRTALREWMAKIPLSWQTARGILQGKGIDAKTMEQLQTPSLEKQAISEGPQPGRLLSWKAIPATALVLAIVMGIAPSSMAPNADWRVRIERPDGILDLQWYMANARGESVREPGPKALSEPCADALKSDAEANRPNWVRTQYSHLGAWKAGQPKTAPMGGTEPR
ncbi:MAG: hypothetical protein VX519_06300 [Myxococcota bacterium]|nr:hypothetical protein [Myxococcota bacterium]